MERELKRWLSAVVVGAVVLVGAAAQAQHEPPAGTPPEMKRLAFLIGKWLGKETSPIRSADGTLRPPIEQQMDVNWAAGGLYLVMGIRTSRSGQSLPDTAVRVFGYDPVAKVYRVWAVDPRSGSGPPDWFEGRFEGTRLILSNEQYLKGLRPNLEGVGVTVNDAPTKEGYYQIAHIERRTAAARAGLRPRDRVTKINGRSVAGMPLPHVVALLGARSGTIVRLGVRRGNRERTISLRSVTLPTRYESTRVAVESRSPTEFVELYRTRGGQTLSEARYTRVP
jgi:hypothetical protein